MYRFGWIYIRNDSGSRRIRADNLATQSAQDGKCGNCNNIVVYNKEYTENQLQYLDIPDDWEGWQY